MPKAGENLTPIEDVAKSQRSHSDSPIIFTHFTHILDQAPALRPLAGISFFYNT